MSRAALLVLALTVACGASRPRLSAPAWRGADARAFADAAAQGRMVLLSVQADWCHWCHVMNATTYEDPEVLALLAEHFVVVRAEADARPDLAERYTNQGWPATIVFAPDGTEIVRLRGHRDAATFRTILRALVDDQRAGRPLGATLDARSTDATAQPEELPRMRALVRGQLDGLYDAREEGWGDEQKYPFGALVRWELVRARLEGDDEARGRALRSLARYAELIDPVWGGMYQYSEQGDWAHPHFEKLASIQAGAIAAFADAYAATGDATWLERARAIVRYVRAFLTSEGGTFYASQDADLRVDGREPVLGATYYALDDAGRRALGVPHVDEHVYASVNGELAAALVRLAEVAPDDGTLALAVRAIETVTRTHRDANGLYRHEATDDGARYLADQAQMLAATIALYEATGGARWRADATALADATLAAFRDDGGALRARAVVDASDPLTAALHPIEENALVAHAVLALARIEEREDRPEDARAILEAIAVPSAVAELGRKIGEYAIALELESSGLVAFTVVGDPDDPRTRALASAVRRYDEPRRVLVVQEGEGTYPMLEEPALFVCGGGACSAPITDPDEVASSADTFFGR